MSQPQALGMVANNLRCSFVNDIPRDNGQKEKNSLAMDSMRSRNLWSRRKKVTSRPLGQFVTAVAKLLALSEEVCSKNRVAEMWK